jgi:hypothetical protein
MTETGVWDPTSYAGKRFRRRFRVPYSIFLEIVAEYKEHVTTLAGRPWKGFYDLRLLVLGALRVLGSGVPFDLIQELNEISEETNRVFFHKFIAWGRGESSKWVFMPRNSDELSHVINIYKDIGWPGAMGSADGVHFYWDKCPAGLANACTGKEKLPTLAFQFIVSHSKWIMSVTNAHMGTDNDKTICRYDSAIQAVRDGQYSKLHFELYTGEGDTTTIEKGLYLIVDGGYHRWDCLVCPYKIQIAGSSSEIWSSALESIRKDVECTFGILKVRFLILKYPLKFHDMESIEDIVHTCAMLHNRLMKYDDRDNWDTTGGEDGSVVDYSLQDSLDGLYSESARLGPISEAVLTNATIAEGRRSESFTRGEYRNRKANRGTVAFFDIATDDDYEQLSRDDKLKFDLRRRKLIEHYEHMKAFAQRRAKPTSS